MLKCFFPAWYAGHILRVLTLCGILFLPGCSPKDPYVPPDLLYLFASYDVGKNPTAIKAGDFNQDGFSDLVTSNISANSLSLLLGNGDGSFQAQVSIRVCKEPRNLAVLDFNGDGHEDLAIACSGSNQVAIFKGQGGGTFEKDGLYPVHRTPVSIAGGDFNSDRHLDLVVALRNDKAATLVRKREREIWDRAVIRIWRYPHFGDHRGFQPGRALGFGGHERRADEQRRIDLVGPGRRYLSPAYRLSDGQAALIRLLRRLQQ